jgi:hypothetical protein
VVESTICAHIQTRADFFFLLKIGALFGALETKKRLADICKGVLSGADETLFMGFLGKGG